MYSPSRLQLLIDGRGASHREQHPKSAPEHALAVEGHPRRVHLDPRVAHDRFHDAVAVLARLVDDPRKHHDFIVLELHRLREGRDFAGFHVIGDALDVGSVRARASKYRLNWDEANPGHAACKMASTVAVLRRWSNLRQSAGTCWWWRERERRKLRSSS